MFGFMSVCQLKSNYFSLIHIFLYGFEFQNTFDQLTKLCQTTAESQRWPYPMLAPMSIQFHHDLRSRQDLLSSQCPILNKSIFFYYFCLWFYLAWINSQIITSVSSADNSKEEVRWDLSHLDGLTIQSQRFSLKKKMLESYICSCSSTHMEDEIMITLLTFWLCGDNGT